MHTTLHLHPPIHTLFTPLSSLPSSLSFRWLRSKGSSRIPRLPPSSPLNNAAPARLSRTPSLPRPPPLPKHSLSLPPSRWQRSHHLRRVRRRLVGRRPDGRLSHPTERAHPLPSQSERIRQEGELLKPTPHTLLRNALTLPSPHLTPRTTHHTTSPPHCCTPRTTPPHTTPPHTTHHPPPHTPCSL